MESFAFAFVEKDEAHSKGSVCSFLDEARKQIIIHSKQGQKV